MKERLIVNQVLVAQLLLAVSVGAGACRQANQTSATTAANTAANSPAAAPTAVVSSSPIAPGGFGPDSPVGSTASVPPEGMSSVHPGDMMIQSAPGAASAAYDLQFLDTMSAHHEGAVEMARIAETKAQHPELKELARKIVADQTKEIKQMQAWRQQWYAGKPKAQNARMPGMVGSAKGMSMDVLKNAAGPQFDMIFLNMMVPHHGGAIAMATDALTKAEHPEIKQLAQKILEEQRREIEQMGEWKLRWSLPPR